MNSKRRARDLTVIALKNKASLWRLPKTVGRMLLHFSIAAVLDVLALLPEGGSGIYIKEKLKRRREEEKGEGPCSEHTQASFPKQLGNFAVR